MNHVPCASALSASLLCPHPPRVTGPLLDLRDPRDGGTCSDSPDDSSQSPSRTCKVGHGVHLEVGFGNLVGGNFHLFEAEGDACPPSGLQSLRGQIHCCGGCSSCCWVVDHCLLDQNLGGADLAEAAEARLSSLQGGEGPGALSPGLTPRTP